MYRTIILSVAAAMLAGNAARADEAVPDTVRFRITIREDSNAAGLKSAPSVQTETEMGKFRVTYKDENEKELTHGWGRRGWGGYRSYGYRGYYRSYYYSTPYYYYYTPTYYYTTPCYYYTTPTYYYYCLSGTLGSESVKSNEPRVSVERAEMQMKLPASLLNGK